MNYVTNFIIRYAIYIACTACFFLLFYCVFLKLSLADSEQDLSEVKTKLEITERNLKVSQDVTERLINSYSDLLEKTQDLKKRHEQNDQMVGKAIKNNPEWSHMNIPDDVKETLR